MPTDNGRFGKPVQIMVHIGKSDKTHDHEASRRMINLMGNITLVGKLLRKENIQGVIIESLKFLIGHTSVSGDINESLIGKQKEKGEWAKEEDGEGPHARFASAF